MKKAANVIVLVIGREEILEFRRGQAERSQGCRNSESSGQREIFVDELAERHNRRAASGVSAHSACLRRSVPPRLAEGKRIVRKGACRRMQTALPQWYSWGGFHRQEE